MVIQQTINGITLGCTYSLIAIGYSLVFSVLELVNLANGAFLVMGAYITLMFYLAFNGHFVLSFLLSVVIMAVLGFLMDRVALMRLRTKKAPKMANIISTMGVATIFENFILIFFGTETKFYPNVLEFGNIHIGESILITSTQITIVFVTLFLMGAVSLIVYKTKMGTAMRSTAQNPEAALLMGVNVNMVISITFIISAVLATASGVMVSMYYHSVDVRISFIVGMKTFAAAVLGGVGFLPGAMLGGIVIGIAESLGASYISSGFRDAIAFGIMIIVLILKPNGLFGKKEINKV